jgi:hypothetical protein
VERPEGATSDREDRVAALAGRPDYSHRRVVDKLGVRPGHRVKLDDAAGFLPRDLVREINDRADTSEGPPFDVVLITATPEISVTALLRHWKSQIAPTGGIWVLTPKRGQSGYLNQTDVIPLGLAAGLVDNKICSVSDSISAMRFVIRRRDRE